MTMEHEDLQLEINRKLDSVKKLVKRLCDYDKLAELMDVIDELETTMAREVKG